MKLGPMPIVNHMHFTDARPTIGSPSANFNPANVKAAAPFPSGPPKTVQVPGKRPTAKGLTNKRIQSTI